MKIYSLKLKGYCFSEIFKNMKQKIVNVCGCGIMISVYLYDDILVYCFEINPHDDILIHYLDINKYPKEFWGFCSCKGFIKNNLPIFIEADKTTLLVYSDFNYITTVFDKFKKYYGFNTTHNFEMNSNIYKILNYLKRKNALFFAENIKNQNNVISQVFNNLHLKIEIIKCL